MTGETRFVDVQCRGLVVAQKARLQATAERAGFVELEAPLPVGTRVTLRGEDGFAAEARVVAVIEQEAGAKSPPGMRLDWSPEAAETSAIAVTSSDLVPVEEAEEAPDEAAEPEPEGPPPTPTDGKRRRRNRKTIIGR